MTEVPKGAKRPADRKPKVEDESTGPLLGEALGIKVEVNRDALDDFELLDDLARIDDGEYVRIPRVLRRLLGNEQMAAAMEGLRDPETGRIAIERGLDFVRELMRSLRPNS